jgi:peptide/nickel transport system substrate-binding protein
MHGSRQDTSGCRLPAVKFCQRTEGKADVHGNGRRRSARARPLGGAGCALLALSLAGCGGAPGSSGDAERLPLRIALHGDPSSLDPHLQSEVVAQSVLGNVYDGLVALDLNMSPIPALAERWENPDDLTWRFHLRAGVVFHDGRALTAGDVVASIERMRGHPRSQGAGYLVAVESAVATGAATVEVRTAQPYPILLNKLAYVAIVPASAPEQIVRPIGTGPYRFVDYEPGGHLRLEGFAEHWRGPPAEPKVEFFFLADPEERLRRLLAGELDLINQLPARNVGELEIQPGFRVAARSSLGVDYLQMSLTTPPFDDPRVRRALDLALDRRQLVEEDLRGQGQPVGQMISPDVFGYDPALLPPERDLETARRLLAEAGHAEGLELTLEYRAGREIAPLVRQLGEAGVKITAVPRPWSEMYPRLNTGVVGFYLGGWVATSADASDLLDHKVHSPDRARGYGRANSNRYRNPEVDARIEQLAAAATMEQRRVLLQQALGRLNQDRAFLPLYTPYELYGLRAGLRWQPRQDARVYAAEMSR